MSRKGTPIDDSPMESFHSILKKETLYNNYITSLEEYIAIVEDWLIFYNTQRLKNRKKSGMSRKVCKFFVRLNFHTSALGFGTWN